MFGLFNLNKPAEMTSRKVVDHVQRLVKPAKAGHAGTLDPLATGVLIVCVGPATRLIPDVQKQRKTYRGTFRLGCTSDTDDKTGTITTTAHPKEVSRNEIAAALPDFLGEIDQVPPQFSAVHVNGKRAYDLARQGQKVQIAAKKVQVFRIELLAYDWPNLELEIECGSGTYIRSIGRDLGEKLGCGALMTDLIRTQIGPFKLEEATNLDELAAETFTEHLHSPIDAVSDLPSYNADATGCERVKRGQGLSVRGEWPTGTRIAIVTETDELAAIGEYEGETCMLKPRQVFLR